MFTPRDHFWMETAITLAKKAESADEVPVGAVLVFNDQALGQGWNRPIADQDPTAHAENVALRDAAKAIGNYRLVDTTLYVTLEPCLMCTGALIQARIKRLVFGAHDPKSGAIESVCRAFTFPSNHQVEHASGLLADQCGSILTAFFQRKRLKD